MEKRVDEAAGRKAVEGSQASETEILEAQRQKDVPPEGPHARADLINEAATPGTGLFSNPLKAANDEVDPGAG